MNSIRALVLLVATALSCAAARASDSIAFAGFAYAGDAAQIASRFPVTRQVEADAKASGMPLGKSLSQAIGNNLLAGLPVSMDGMSSLTSGDQALATAFVITSETSSVERFGDLYKVLTAVRAQAMIFDFKSMTVVRASPMAVAYLDVQDHAPSDSEKRERVRQLFMGGSKPGLFARYVQVLSAARLPAPGTRYLQVSKVNVMPDALARFPERIRGNGEIAQSWIADTFGEGLLDRADVAVLPYRMGYAIGNAMAMRFASGEVFNLKLPEPDYTIEIDLKGLKRVEYGNSTAGTSYIYASYSHVKIAEPVSGRAWLDADFKNGEVKLVPSTQTSIDDFPAYSDSMRGLFTKLATVLGGQDTDWLAASASGENIKKQINVSRELIKSCR